MSRNIEINIKTQDASTQETQYEVLYPKNTAKNVVFNPDSGDNVTVYDKLNNLTPNDTFEIGDILCTSKINVDTEKWKLCDGTKLNRDDYPSLFDITNLKNISGLKDITDMLKPSDLDLQGWWECNGYYFRYIQETEKVTLYRCLKSEDLTVKRNWDNLILETSSFSIYSLYDIAYINNHFVLSCEYGKHEGSDDDEGEYYYLTMYIINPDDFTVFKKVDYNWSSWINGSSRDSTIYKAFTPIYCNGAYRFLTEINYGSNTSHSLRELIYTVSSNSTVLGSGGFSVNGDTVISYAMSSSGYIELSIYKVNGGYCMYLSNAPTGTWDRSNTYNRGWKAADKEDGSSITNIIQKTIGKYFFFQDKTYTNDLSEKHKDDIASILIYEVLGSIQGVPYCWNYDNTILYSYDSTNKVFYVYHLENDIFVLQYTLVNTDSYSFGYDNLSPNEVPLKLQDSKYQEMQNGIETPTITQTAQYKYYIKVK